MQRKSDASDFYTGGASPAFDFAPYCGLSNTACGVTNSQRPTSKSLVLRFAAVLATKESNLTMEHAVRKPVESRRAYRKRKNTIVLGMILALILAAAMAVLLVG